MFIKIIVFYIFVLDEEICYGKIKNFELYLKLWKSIWDSFRDLYWFI